MVPLWQRALARVLRILQCFVQARRLRRRRLDTLTLLQRRDYEEAIAAEKGNPLTRLAFLHRRRISPAKAFVYWLG